MAFDGITIANIVKEMKEVLIGGRLYKIAQPENDELLLTIKGNGTQYRLMISVNASLPLLYLTEKNKQSPMTAPNFCMVLRKYIQNGRIVEISQPDMERIVRIEIEHLDEMGDLCKKYLIIELMGKHSNIIFCNEKDVIIDSIKHISGMVSSVREVLPSKPYFIAKTMEKKNPLDTNESEFRENVFLKSGPVYKSIYGSYTGISPLIANEICYRAKVDGNLPRDAFSQEEMDKIYNSFQECMDVVKKNQFCPCIAYFGKNPIEYAGVQLTMYETGKDRIEKMDSMSYLLETFYEEKNVQTRIRQKSVDLRKIVQTVLERNIKKYDLQIQQMKDTMKKDKYRLYGELIHTYGYGVKEGSKSFEAFNYYTNEMITIPLDENMTPAENAQKYFDKYGKMKRTFEALEGLTKEVKEEIEHLESINAALDIAVAEPDLVQIKQELIESGYIKRKGKTSKEKITSKPFHYISSEGYDIYVGKNNFQNEDLTFQFATGNDWWFHAKGMAGSHVIVKAPRDGQLPDSTFEEAAKLAAYYSKAKEQKKVEVDYTQKKNVKKPAGGKPGFVVYYTNYSMAIEPDISEIKMEK